jgi:hypothetical protein
MSTNETPDSRNTEDRLVRQAADHLRGILEMLGPCEHFDHSGNCQTHFIERPCRVGMAREFLKSLPNASQVHASKASVARRLLNEIHEQATRHRRACSLKKYLIQDLLIIESIVIKALGHKTNAR